MAASPSQTAERPHIVLTGKQRRISLVAVVLGNFLEWFDWTLYAIFTTYIAVTFFHAKDEISGVLSTLLVFAVGFLARPVGGFLFGWIGDKYGRKNAMFLAMVLMATGSALIGLMPSWNSIGVWATVGLTVARLVQGIAHGGETGGAYTYMAEIAPKEKRGLYGSFIMMTVTIGVMSATALGVLTTSVFTKEQMTEWGWRIPFLLGALLAIVALVIRSRAQESPVYEEARLEDGNENTAPIVTATKKQLAIIALRIVILTSLGQVMFYTWKSFFSSYAIDQKGMDPNGAYLASLGAQAIGLIALPLWAMFSDKFGRKKTVSLGALGVIVVAFPVSWILGEQPWTLFVAQGIALIVWAILSSIYATLSPELAPTAARARSVGVWSSVSAALIGGTAPYLNTWLSDIGLGWVFTLYMMFIALVTLITVRFIPETVGLDMNEIPLPGEAPQSKKTESPALV